MNKIKMKNCLLSNIHKSWKMILIKKIIIKLIYLINKDKKYNNNWMILYNIKYLFNNNYINYMNKGNNILKCSIKRNKKHNK